MKTNLILLTHAFPDQKNEVFLWGEIPFLEYDNIIICSMVGNGELNEFHKRYSDISVIRCGSTLKFPHGVIWWVKSIVRKEFWKELIRLISAKKLNKSSFVRLLRCTSYGERMFNIISKNINFRLKDERYIVYSYWMTSLAYCAIRLKSKYDTIKLSLSRCHGHDLYCYRYDNDDIEFQKFYLNNLDFICPISSNGKKYLIDRYGKSFEKKLIISRLGTFDHGIQIAQDHTFTIISCSSMIKLKRLDKIIDTLETLETYKIKWIHFGDGPLFNELSDYANRKISRKDNIEFEFAGHVNNDDLMNIYSQSYYDVFINVSETEGIPVSIMEALSFGIPVIATDVGGCSELVDSSCGYLIRKDFDTEELKEIIIQAIHWTVEVRESFRRKARYKWETEYCANTNYSNLHKFIFSTTDSLQDL